MHKRQTYLRVILEFRLFSPDWLYEHNLRSSDLPYIFEKGFTGDSGAGRKKATGMGLYLAKEIADDLKLLLEADSLWGKGFVMTIKFPVIN